MVAGVFVIISSPAQGATRARVRGQHKPQGRYSVRTTVYLIIMHSDALLGIAASILGIYLGVQEANRQANEFTMAGVEGVRVEEVPVGCHLDFIL